MTQTHSPLWNSLLRHMLATCWASPYSPKTMDLCLEERKPAGSLTIRRRGVVSRPVDGSFTARVVWFFHRCGFF